MASNINNNKRRNIWHKYNCHCAYCGCELEYDKMQIDHIIPLQRGMSKKESIRYGILKGSNGYKNLNPSCGSCNRSKSDFKLEAWRSEIELKVSRIRRDSSTFRILERFKMVEINKQNVTFYFENYGKTN